ncbi:hypothetical protein [uncultured Paracoccus sp.]|uniref:hypothetical protein n=1 Tax=uncultured Paracoccus sp. TaxID=189685 RepID=UPI00260D160F|nr:hypothetical protein [uncultured Paracoccus sp.]
MTDTCPRLDYAPPPGAKAKPAGRAPARPGGLALWCRWSCVQGREGLGTMKRAGVPLQRHPTGRRSPSASRVAGAA